MYDRGPSRTFQLVVRHPQIIEALFVEEIETAIRRGSPEHVGDCIRHRPEIHLAFAGVVEMVFLCGHEPGERRASHGADQNQKTGRGNRHQAQNGDADRVRQNGRRGGLPKGGRPHAGIVHQ